MRAPDATPLRGHLPALFISDLHLDPRRPRILQLFSDFLRGQAAQVAALYILGDLFEAWIGDDDDAPACRAVQSALRELSDRGVALFLLHGNRDFLLGERFAARTGAALLVDETVLDLGGERVLLMHGDTLCTDDAAYQVLRMQLRTPAWQAQFLARPLPQRRHMAALLREESEQAKADKPPEIMDVNPDAVTAVMRTHGVRLLIHGHTHRPAVHDFTLDGAPARRIVLGDWYAQGSVLIYSDGTAPELVTLSPAS